MTKHFSLSLWVIPSYSIYLNPRQSSLSHLTWGSKLLILIFDFGGREREEGEPAAAPPLALFWGQSCSSCLPPIICSCCHLPSTALDWSPAPHWPEQRAHSHFRSSSCNSGSSAITTAVWSGGGQSDYILQTRAQAEATKGKWQWRRVEGRWGGGREQRWWGHRQHSGGQAVGGVQAWQEDKW